MLRLEGSVEDVTLRRRAEDRLAHVSLHDGLTNLPNRALFIDRLSQSLARLRLAGAGSTTVVLIDYDGLKLINDSLGHAVGDRLLVEMARRLPLACGPAIRWRGWPVTNSSCWSKGWRITTRRCPSPSGWVRLFHALRSRARSGRDISDRQHRRRLQPGMHGETPDDLLRYAGTALHQAKAQGRSRCLAFRRKCGRNRC